MGVKVSPVVRHVADTLYPSCTLNPTRVSANYAFCCAPVIIFDFVIVSIMCRWSSNCWSSPHGVDPCWNMVEWPTISTHDCMLAFLQTDRMCDACLTLSCAWHTHQKRISFAHRHHVKSSPQPPAGGDQGGGDADWRTGVLRDAFP